MVSVGVAGASGYGGGELLRLLADHPHFSVQELWANSSAGQSVGAVHPHLAAYAQRTFTAFDPSTAEGLDLVFTALPHGQSAALVAQLPPEVAVVDLGADFRLADPQRWAAYYGSEHAGVWPYGLPELPGQRTRLAGARRIANPGCYATAISLAYAPLAAAGLIDAADLVVVAASGTSGAGRSPSVALMASEITSGMRAYKVGGVHQHTPEIEQALAAAAPGAQPVLGFTPMLAPMSRGILATCTARSLRPTTAAQARDVLAAQYADEPFVRLLPEGQWPATQMTLGSNSAVLQAAVDDHTGRIVVVSAIDNLGKGAAGQAVQNANAIFGFGEATGLPVQGVAP